MQLRAINQNREKDRKKDGSSTELKASLRHWKAFFEDIQDKIKWIEQFLIIDTTILAQVEIDKLPGYCWKCVFPGHERDQQQGRSSLHWKKTEELHLGDASHTYGMDDAHLLWVQTPKISKSTLT